MANSGTLHNLLKAVGWFTRPTTNLTQQERRDAGSPELREPPEAKPNPWGLPANPSQRFAELLAMSRSALIAPIVELYAEETTQPDINKGKTLWFECNDSAVEKDINDMLDRIHLDDYIYAIATNICATGNEFQRILWSPEDGVQQLVGCPPDAVTRLWHPTNRKLLGFRWKEQKPGDPMYSNAEDVFAPWDFLHFRRICSTETEYGQGMLDHLYPLWKKLELASDQMVLYRLHTMPNRFAFKIDIGNADFSDGMMQAEMWRKFLRQQTGMQQQNPGAVGLQSRFDPAAVDSFLILPIRGAEDKTEITTLAGDKDVPDIQDIELLEKQLLGGARVPRGYLGREEGSGLANASLVSQDIRFARMVRVLRRPLIAGFLRLAQLHLAFKGKDPTRYKIRVKMSKISSIEEEINIATLEKQAMLASEIAGLCQTLGIPNREIVDLVFREYLSVPRYFMDVAKMAMSVAAVTGAGGDGAEGSPGGMGGGMGGGMMGGGMGDLGDDPLSGELDFSDEDGGDLDSLPELPPPATPQEARQRASLLVETRRRGRAAKSVLETVRHIQSFAASHRPVALEEGTMTEERRTELRNLDEAVGEHRASISAAVRSITEIALGSRVSLVEAFESNAGEPAHGMLTEALRFSDAGRRRVPLPQVDMVETAPQEMRTEVQVTVEEHPAVAVTRALREAETRKKREDAGKRTETAEHRRRNRSEVDNPEDW